MFYFIYLLDKLLLTDQYEKKVLLTFEMDEIGQIVHVAMSGRLIVKLDKEIKPGQIIIDDKGNKIGKIIELIGPVSSPYASIELNNKEYNKKQYFNGLQVYRSESNQFAFKKQETRNRKFTRGGKKTR